MAISLAISFAISVETIGGCHHEQVKLAITSLVTPARIALGFRCRQTV
jgi:hypothetical protein